MSRYFNPLVYALIALACASCSRDDIRPMVNNDNEEVGQINCTKQTLLIKKGYKNQALSSYGYKTGEWLTAGQHQIAIDKSGIRSFQGMLAGQFVSELITKRCDN